MAANRRSERTDRSLHRTKMVLKQCCLRLERAVNAVFESVLRKVGTDLCPKMMVGEHVGDTFIWTRTDATCWVSTE